MKFKFITMLLVLFGLGVFSQTAKADDSKGTGYRIEVEIPNEGGKKAYLATYWNDTSYAVDSLVLSDQGKGVFQSDKRLTEGQYLLYVAPDLQLDLLIGETQDNIRLFVNTSSLAKCVVQGSNDTQLLWNYLIEQVDYNTKKDQLEEQLDQEQLSKAKKDELNKTLAKLEAKYEKLTKDEIEQHKGTWFSTFIKGTQYITLPHTEPKNNQERDANKAYFKNHYFDNVDFNDPRIWTTNYISGFIDSYMHQIENQEPDSLAADVSKIVARTVGNETSFKHMISRQINNSMNSPIMGRENVWARLFEEYLLDKDVQWMDSTEMSNLRMNFELLRNNRIGMKANNLSFVGINGQIVNTNELKHDYLVLFFYSTTCSHCLVQTPILHDEIYPKYKDKGLQVVAINTDPELSKENWRMFIDKYKISDWVNVADPEYKSQFWMNFDVSATPILYVLDKDKKIIARKVLGENLEKVLEFYID